MLAGVFTTTYDIDVLDKMISPLYEDGEGTTASTFNIFIYANEIIRETYK